jgi:hypothetical protein
LSSISGVVNAGFYGQVDGRVQTDTHFNNSMGFIEEYADIRFVDDANGVESGLSFALRQDDENEANVYQMYFSKKLDGLLSAYKLGRFERADSLGFYTLDGAVLNSNNDDFLLKMYAGNPSRIDDYAVVSGEALYGFDIYFSAIKLPRLSSDILFKTSEARIGWQRLEDEMLETKQHETRLNWGLSSSGEITNSIFLNFGIDFNGSYLTSKDSTEQLQFKFYGDLEKNKRLQIDYETFSLDDPELSFREQFYSVYVKGRQTSLAASYFFSSSSTMSWSTRGRTVLREHGENGYGLTLGLDLNKYSGTEYLAQVDFLKLDKDSALSIYGETNYSFSPLITSRFSAAIQHQQKWLSGNNQAVAIEADFQQMIRSDLYFTFFVSRVWNSHVDDEYLFGLKLSYRFDDRAKGWFDE